MLLSELPWKEPSLSSWKRECWVAGYMVFENHDNTYDFIKAGNWCWRAVDMLATQAILFHITSEGYTKVA